MKEITAFKMFGCPYCANAMKAIQELVEEHPEYKDIALTWHDESEAASLDGNYRFDYVPCMFIDGEKKYEAQPGESYNATKELIKAVFDQVIG